MAQLYKYNGYYQKYIKPQYSSLPLTKIDCGLWVVGRGSWVPRATNLLKSLGLT